MKNELGHIIKKKVENSSMTPPPMDWSALSDVQKVTPKTSKSFITSKIGLITSGVVSIAIVIVVASLLSSPEEIERQVPNDAQKVIVVSDSIQEEQPYKTIDTMANSSLEEKEINTPVNKKKDKFTPRSKKNKQEGARDKKTEQSTTTILYEVDTVTTETYIYE